MRRTPSRSADRTPPSALSTAVRMLARREYARAELRARLIARGVSEEAADAALDELAGRGFLSDARYAEALVARKAGRWGARAIAHELREKGVEAGAASSALASLAGRDEVVEALALLRTRYDAPRSRCCALATMRRRKTSAGRRARFASCSHAATRCRSR
ncbi:MAG: regulatory protein RecX [Betaproteobacteria bacterium PRO3]|nr:regulatory protein RecX [Betaproteobacteria bacterium PRO3]